MSHRAALYLVRIRQLRQADDWQLMGDYDEAGTWLGDTLQKLLFKIDDSSRDGKVRAKFESALPALKANHVGVSLLSGRSGVTSVLEKPGADPFERTPDHSEAMRSAFLFNLPPDRKVGRLAVHVPHGRSCKGLVESALRKSLSPLGYKMDLGPIVPVDALRSAVERNAIEKVTLIKHQPVKNDRFHDAAQWGDEEVDRIELSIPSRRRMRLKSDPLRQFLDQPTGDNRQRIVEFSGLIFDEVAVAVDMPEGGQRTFYLDERESGHPMTVGINIHGQDRYGARSEQLSHELTAALSSVPPRP